MPASKLAVKLAAAKTYVINLVVQTHFVTISIHILTDKEIAPDRERESTYRHFGETLKQRGFRGDILFDHGSRTVYSTDNSIYQRFPQAILCPLDTADVVHIAELSQQ